MKILCFIDSLGSGGAQRQLVNLAIEFKIRGHCVSFLIYHEDYFFRSALVDNNIKVHLVNEKRPILRILKIRKFIRGGSFGAIISFLETPNFIAELSGFPIRNWKLIVGERSADPQILKSIKLRFYRYMHFFSDTVVANSAANMEMVKKINPFLNDKKCNIIYNTIDLDYWKPSFQYKVRANGKTVVFIAASHRYLKNSIGLIEAVKCLTNEELQRLNVKWYGASNHDNSYIESKDLIEYYGLNQVIEFFPFTNNNILEEMANSDCCALFSFFEGLPNTICEGMALGKPILATKVSDIPKLIDEGLGGYLCEPNSIISIRDGLRKIIYSSNDQLVAMGKYNRAKAILLFDKEIIVDGYLNLVENTHR